MAVSTYMMRASENLRAQISLCKKIWVKFTDISDSTGAQYANRIMVGLPYPTNEVRVLT
jgi:DNA polymerase V